MTLQYSVGIDPLPSVDPLPWEAWRTKKANVDTIGDVTANDAALILQYSAKLINTFPANSMFKIEAVNTADVSITQEGELLVFRSQGNLIGLNLFVKENYFILGYPTVLDPNMIRAFNIDADNYALGLATAYAPGISFRAITYSLNLMCLLCSDVQLPVICIIDYKIAA